MVEMDESILAIIGNFIAPVFAPLGWGAWHFSVAAIAGLVAKENIVSTFGILFGSPESGGVSGALAGSFTMLSAFSFLIFNLLCAPCVAAMGAIKNEMNNAKWFWGAIGYQCGLAYIVSLCIYQFGMLFSGHFGAGTVFAILLTAGFFYMLFRRGHGSGTGKASF